MSCVEKCSHDTIVMKAFFEIIYNHYLFWEQTLSNFKIHVYNEKLKILIKYGLSMLQLTNTYSSFITCLAEELLNKKITQEDYVMLIQHTYQQINIEEFEDDIVDEDEDNYRSNKRAKFC